MSILKDKEYMRLIEKVFEETIEEDEVQILQKKLESSPELFQDYLSNIDFHEDLKSYWAYQTDISLGLVEEKPEVIKLDKRQMKSRSRRLLVSKGRGKQGDTMKNWLSVAAIFAVVIFLSVIYQLTVPKELVNLKDRIVYVLETPGKKVDLADRMKKNPLDVRLSYLDEGETLVIPEDRVAYLQMLNSKTSMQLAPQTSVQFAMTPYGPKIHLINGSMTADIEKQQEGHYVRFLTPKLSAKILGTEIKMNAIDEHSFFSVAEGQVEVMHQKTKQIVRLDAEQAVAITPGSKFEVKSSIDVLKLRLSKMKSLMLWLDAADKANFILDGHAIKRWAGHGPRKKIARQDERNQMPILQENVINGLSAVYFNAEDNHHMLFGDIEDNVKSSWTYFLVLKADKASKNAKVLGGQDGYHIGLSGGSYYYTEISLGRKTIRSDLGKVEVVSFVLDELNDQTLISKNGKIKSTHDDFDGERWLKARLSGDGENPDNNYTGYIGEILVFNRALAEIDRREIESYLTSKWLSK